jgi:hypothetical protein
VRLRRELISPEEALNELRALADNEQCAVKVRAYILEQLDALSEAGSGQEDSAADGLRAALRQKSENIRRDAVAMILDRVMAPPAMRDYEAAKRHSDRIEAIHRRSTELSVSPEPPSIGGTSAPKVPANQAALATARRTVVMPILTARGWSRGKWGTKAGVGKNCVYEYLDGERRLSPPNRKAMAEALELKPEDLPE